MVHLLSNADLSIHAPTRGATLLSFGLGHFMKLSIHAPTRGATLTMEFPETFKDLSIHAPTRGATLFNTNRSA